GVERREQLVERRVVGHRLDRRADLRLGLAHPLEQHVLFGREVKVKRTAADPRGLGDVLGPARGHAVTAKDRQRRLIEPTPGLLALLFAGRHAVQPGSGAAASSAFSLNFSMHAASTSGRSFLNSAGALPIALAWQAAISMLPFLTQPVLSMPI